MVYRVSIIPANFRLGWHHPLSHQVNFKRFPFHQSFRYSTIESHDEGMSAAMKPTPVSTFGHAKENGKATWFQKSTPWWATTFIRLSILQFAIA